MNEQHTIEYRSLLSKGWQLIAHVETEGDAEHWAVQYTRGAYHHKEVRIRTDEYVWWYSHPAHHNVAGVA